MFSYSLSTLAPTISFSVFSAGILSIFFLDKYKETQSKEIVTAHRAGFLK